MQVPQFRRIPGSGRAVAICTSIKGERAKGRKSPLHVNPVEIAKTGRE
jgi:hypothetical protein